MLCIVLGAMFCGDLVSHCFAGFMCYVLKRLGTLFCGVLNTMLCSVLGIMFCGVEVLGFAVF